MPAVVALVTLSLLAWAYIIRMAAGMDAAADAAAHALHMAMPRAHAWQPGDVALTFAMWAVMMVAMMTPAAAPLVLAFHGLQRQRARAHTAALLGGYLLVWTLFSVAATLLQWALHSAGQLSPHMLRAAPLAGGSVLLLAGAYQFTPLKRVCLTRCRAPLDFLMTRWRDGTRGALGMGMHHGAYCVGCCWALMLVLFAAGIMNLLWVAAIALVVLAEKTLPAGQWIGRPIGVLVAGWGAWLLVGALAA